jgi:hypothetical protein
VFKGSINQASNARLDRDAPQAETVEFGFPLKDYAAKLG